MTDRTRTDLFTLSLAAIAVLASLRAAEIWDVRFGTGDEVWQSWSLMRHELWHNAAEMARNTGRVYFLLYLPISAAVTSLRSNLVYNLLNVGTFLAGSILPVWVLRAYLGRSALLLFLLFYFALFPQLWHLPPAAYPVVNYYPLLFAAAAAVALQRWIGNGAPLWASIAVPCFFIGLFQYESVTIFVLLYVAVTLALLAAAGLTGEERGRWRRAVQLLAATATLYALLYLGFRFAFPTVYAGNQLAPFDLHSAWYVIWKFAAGSSALFNFFDPIPLGYGDPAAGPATFRVPGDLWDVVRNATALQVAAAAAAFAGAVGALVQSRQGVRFGLLLALAAGLALALGGNVLHALTPQYQAWAVGKQAWVGSRFSYFGLTLLLAASVVAVASLLPRRLDRVFAVLVAALAGFAALVTTHDNEAVAAQMRIRTARWEALRLAAACRPVVAAMQDRVVHVPRLQDVIGSADAGMPEFWDLWMRRNFGLTTRIVGDPNDAARAADLRFDYRVADSGRATMAIVVPDAARAANGPVLLALRAGARGFLSYRQADGTPRSRFVDGAAGEACNGGGYLVRLAEPVLLDSIELGPLPRTRRLETPVEQPALVFGLGKGDPHEVKAAGWSAAEVGGTWSVEHVATLRLPPIECPDGGLTLVLEGTAFRPPGSAPLDVTVRVNGEELARVQFGNVMPFDQPTLRIPASLLRGRGGLDIAIEAAELRSPAKWGSSDVRTLGVFLRRVLLRP
jgi:hypothetical protein